MVSKIKGEQPWIISGIWSNMAMGFSVDGDFLWNYSGGFFVVGSDGITVAVMAIRYVCGSIGVVGF